MTQNIIAIGQTEAEQDEWRRQAIAKYWKHAVVYFALFGVVVYGTYKIAMLGEEEEAR